MKKLAILEKTALVCSKSGSGVDDQELYPGVFNSIVKLDADNWMISIVSNRDIKGHQSLNEAIAEMKYCISLLPGNIAFRIYFCPGIEGYKVYAGDHKGFESYGWLMGYEESYWLPGPGMLRLAIKEAFPMELEPSVDRNVVFIGDHPEAAAAAGVRFQMTDEWRLQAASHLKHLDF